MQRSVHPRPGAAGLEEGLLLVRQDFLRGVGWTLPRDDVPSRAGERGAIYVSPDGDLFEHFTN